MKYKVIMPGAAELIRRKGLAVDGAVQMFHTQNVLNRLENHMPHLTGATYTITVTQTDIRKPEIVTDTPYARYLFYGKVMVDPQTGAAGFLTLNGWRSRKGCTKVRTDRDLEFTKIKPQAGPRWDKALVAAEGDALRADLQRYIDRRSGR